MNFFEAQDNARRKTWQLVVLFGAAVVSLIVLTNLLVAAVTFFSSTTAYGGYEALSGRLAAMPAETWALISVLVIGVIGVASLYKYLALRGGGRAIAEMLGGQLLTRDTAGTSGKRTLNVVEEMAIASGLPVPPVYVIEEPSINAFAAGLSPDDAVIGVNRGTMDHLSRDELQGVIAHEFSHILNGDTRINLRLIAVLHGIVFLSMIGHTLLRGMRFGGRRRSGNGHGAVLALGLGLTVIGYSGAFFGNLIKAAVSRQREYLADAAAVQFTRNPEGIAGALKKIGGLAEGSEITSAAAEEASHMFFGQAQTHWLNSLMATHPPLPKRIEAIDPSWDGRFLASGAARAPASEAHEMAAREAVSGFSGTTEAAPASTVQSEADDTVIDEVGRLSEDGLTAARRIMSDTDPLLRDAAHDGFGSRALLYALLMDSQRDKAQRQLTHLMAEAEAGVPELTERLLPLTRALSSPQRLMLVDMAMPALKSLSSAQYQRFVGNCIALIKADRRISLLEWVTHRLLLKELRPHFEGPRPVRIKHRSTRAVPGPTATLLSALARAGHPDDTAAAEQAFAAGAAALDLKLEFDSAEDPNFQDLNAAMAELRRLKPLAKPSLLKACAAVALTDGVVSDNEGTLLQGVAAALDCPLPPSIFETRAVRESTGVHAPVRSP